MRAFVGIPLADELSAEIEQITSLPTFKEFFRMSRLEPHLTLKAPQTLPADLIPEWIEAATQAIYDSKPPTLQVGGLFFLTPMSIVLRVESEPVCDLHLRLVEQLARFNTPDIIAHEGDDYIAHVTTGRAIKQIAADERNQILQELKATAPPRPIRPKMARLYGMDTLDEGYQTLGDIPFSESY